MRAICSRPGAAACSWARSPGRSWSASRSVATRSDPRSDSCASSMSEFATSALARTARCGLQPTIRQGGFCASLRHGDGASEAGIAAASTTGAAARIALAELFYLFLDTGLRQAFHDILGCDFAGLTQLRNGELGLALRLIDARARRMGVNLAGTFERDGLVEISERADKFALFRPGHAPPHQRIRIIGFDLQRAIEVGEGAIRLSLGEQGLAANRAGDGVVLV